MADITCGLARLRHTGRMSHLTPELLAEVVGAELEATGLSAREIQRRTGLARDTLKRRIAAGSLDSRDLIKAANLLDVPLSKLVAKAEETAA